MKIFVAGATGVLGRVVVPLLLEQGHEVASFSRREAPCMGAEVRQLAGDIFDREKTLQNVRSFSPEVLVHLVTDLKQRNSSANADIRLVGTRNLVDAAQKAGVRKIVAQSIAWAYEPGESVAVEATSLDDEAAPPRKITIDGVVALERISGEMSEHTILRLGVLYGPNTWYSREGWVAEDVLDGRIVANRAITNFLHVDDAAQAFAEALFGPTVRSTSWTTSLPSGRIGCRNTLRSWERRLRRETTRLLPLGALYRVASLTLSVGS